MDFSNPFNFEYLDWNYRPRTAEEIEEYREYATMPAYETVGTYVYARHLERYEQALREEVKSGAIDINRTTERVPEPEHAEVAWTRLKWMECTRMKGKALCIYADAVMEAEIEISQKARLRSYAGKLPATTKDEVRQWFRIKGVLDLRGRDNVIEGVEIYSKWKRRPGTQLSEYLIPILPLSQMDKEAERILTEYGMEYAVTERCRVDVRQLAYNMGLNTTPARLSRDDKIQAELYLHDASAPVYHPDGREDFLPVDRNSVLVDDCACRTEEELDDAVAHECAHKAEHEAFFWLQRLYNDNVETLSFIGSSCGNDRAEDTYEKEPEWEEEDYDPEMEQIDWAEWQARMLTPRIRIPATQARKKIKELIRKHKRAGENMAQVYERVISDLAAFYGVSEITARNRMRSLGFADAAGACNYVDGVHIPAYTTTKGWIKWGTTYDISRADAGKLYESDLMFRAAVDSGAFVFVENHYCLNDPRFIAKQGLTDWARSHIDQCCLLFEVSRRWQKSPYDKEAFHNDDWKNNPLAVARASVASDILGSKSSDVREQIKELPISFAETLKYYRKKEGMTQEQFAELVGIERVTLARYETARNPKITKQMVAQIGVACHLSGEFTEDLMQKAGCPLDYKDPRDFILQIVIYHMFTQSVEDCNLFLTDHGCLPLGSRKKAAS